MSDVFVLHGSPHSLYTYKVALMLRLCSVSFSFRYVSFQKGMQLRPEFRALSRWGQVPALEHGGRCLVQSAAILETCPKHSTASLPPTRLVGKQFANGCFGMPTGSRHPCLVGTAWSWGGGDCCRCHSIPQSSPDGAAQVKQPLMHSTQCLQAESIWWAIGRRSPTSVAMARSHSRG